MEESAKTVERIIEHITADMQSTDGQYVQLGFAPRQNTNDAKSWSDFSSPPNLNYRSENQHIPLENLRTDVTFEHTNPNMTFGSQNISYNSYINSNVYPGDVDNHGRLEDNLKNYIYYPPNIMGYPPPNNECMYAYTRNVNMPGLQENDTFLNSNYFNYPPAPHKNISNNPTQLIENLSGNWSSSVSGAYTPFGTEHSNFMNHLTLHTNNEPENGIYTPFGSAQPVHADVLFESKSVTNEKSFDEQPFSEGPLYPKPNLKKARMVAEVKPMRLSYSDVLTKSVPNSVQRSSNNKIDTKDIKSKGQANKKSVKNDKVSKQFSSQSNFKADKSENEIKTSEQTNEVKHQNLSRKWVSLDNISNESYANQDELKNLKNRKDEKDSSKAKKAKKTQKNSLDTSSNSSKPSEENDISRHDDKLNKNVIRRVSKEKFQKSKSDRIEKLIGCKKGHKTRKREVRYLLGKKIHSCLSKWSKTFLSIMLWFLHLLSDIATLSLHLMRDLCALGWSYFKVFISTSKEKSLSKIKRIKFVMKLIEWIDKIYSQFGRKFWKKKDSENLEDKNWASVFKGLENNIAMPSTGEEAMKRLLACKGKDPYSILGVTPTCTDDDIKKYYKRQAFLVHPDKNQQPGAEEAFKILVHAFEIIGEPGRRESYDRIVAESHQAEQAWTELNDLLSKLQQKMEYAANTIKCTNCAKRHKRVLVERPCYAARKCAQCKIHHSAKEGDIWAESTYMGFLWHYYACMEGNVYDITDWAGCQKKNLRHLKPNSHNVQYRIVLGKQTHSGSPYNQNKAKGKNPSDTNLEEFLNNLYKGKENSPTANEHSDAKDSFRKKKNKKKK